MEKSMEQLSLHAGSGKSSAFGLVHALWGMIILLTVSIALNGCAQYRLYPGEARPNSEVAVLVYKYSEPFLSLQKVDAVKQRFNSRWDASYRIELLPGPHTLSIWSSAMLYVEGYASERKSAGLVPIDFTAQAGRVYTLRTELIYNKWRVWIEDITGKAY